MSDYPDHEPHFDNVWHQWSNAWTAVKSAEAEARPGHDDVYIPVEHPATNATFWLGVDGDPER